MAFGKDFSVIRDIVLHRDTACAETAGGRPASALAELERVSLGSAKDDFLLQAMKVLALAGNGHTRIIPNPAIQVLPVRYVALGQGIYVTAAPSTYGMPPDCSVLAVNDRAINDVFEMAKPYLAGTQARQRAIFPILLAWPAALNALGISQPGQDITLDVTEPDGRPRRVGVPEHNTVPADTLYPMREHGWPDADHSLEYVICHRPAPGVQMIQMTEFHDPAGTTLDTQIALAADHIARHSDDNLILDLRGNRGGSFLRTLPVIDSLQQHWRGKRCAVLVDKFTFSAAIVFVALVFDRLKDRMGLIGEEMGDSLTFHAEGDLITLEQSGAMLRYSDAFHDWADGTSDATTPPDILRHLVSAADMPAVLFEDISACDRRCGPDPHLRRALAFLNAR